MNPHTKALLIGLLLLLILPSGYAAAEPTPVEIGVRLEQLTNIDQRAENFSAVIQMRMRYREPALAVEPGSDTPGARLLTLGAFLKLVEERGLQWPEPHMQNQQGRRDVNSEVVSLAADGTVDYVERSTMTFQAPDFDFRSFPFDHQVFYIRVRQVLPDTVYQFRPLAGASGIAEQLGEEEWVVYEYQTQVSSEPGALGQPSSEFRLSFRAHRHLTYYITRIFVPMLVILLVSWITFQLRDFVKRVDLGVTTLLLFIAFNFAVSSDLPRLGYITAMDAFMTGSFVITGAVLLVNVMFRKLQTSGREDLAYRLDRYAIWGYWPAYAVGMSAALLLL